MSLQSHLKKVGMNILVTAPLWSLAGVFGTGILLEEHRTAQKIEFEVVTNNQRTRNNYVLREYTNGSVVLTRGGLAKYQIHDDDGDGIAERFEWGVAAKRGYALGSKEPTPAQQELYAKSYNLLK